MTIKDNQTHTVDALARLPNQFINSGNLRNLITIDADRFQGLNDEFIKMLNETSLSTSVGKQLDNIATILDLVRIVGESDTDFRARILSATAALARSGEPEHIIDVFLLATSAASIFYQEIYPAGIQVTAHVASDPEDADLDATIIETMNNTKAGGVDIILIISTETDFFTFDSSDFVDGSGNGEISASAGFGSNVGGETDGGQLSRVVT